MRAYHVFSNGVVAEDKVIQIPCKHKLGSKG
jgi:hypothetical protein